MTLTLTRAVLLALAFRSAAAGTCAATKIKSDGSVQPSGAYVCPAGRSAMTVQTGTCTASASDCNENCCDKGTCGATTMMSNGLVQSSGAYVCPAGKIRLSGTSGVCGASVVDCNTNCCESGKCDKTTMMSTGLVQSPGAYVCAAGYVAKSDQTGTCGASAGACNTACCDAGTCAATTMKSTGLVQSTGAYVCPAGYVTKSVPVGACGASAGACNVNCCDAGTCAKTTMMSTGLVQSSGAYVCPAGYAAKSVTTGTCGASAGACNTACCDAGTCAATTMKSTGLVQPSGAYVCPAGYVAKSVTTGICGASAGACNTACCDAVVPPTLAPPKPIVTILNAVNGTVMLNASNGTLLIPAKSTLNVVNGTPLILNVSNGTLLDTTRATNFADLWHPYILLYSGHCLVAALFAFLSLYVPKITAGIILASGLTFLISAIAKMPIWGHMPGSYLWLGVFIKWLIVDLTATIPVLLMRGIKMKPKVVRLLGYPVYVILGSNVVWTMFYSMDNGDEQMAIVIVNRICGGSLTIALILHCVAICQAGYGLFEVRGGMPYGFGTSFDWILCYTVWNVLFAARIGLGTTLQDFLFWAMMAFYKYSDGKHLPIELYFGFGRPVQLGCYIGFTEFLGAFVPYFYESSTLTDEQPMPIYSSTYFFFIAWLNMLWSFCVVFFAGRRLFCGLGRFQERFEAVHSLSHKGELLDGSEDDDDSEEE